MSLTVGTVRGRVLRAVGGFYRVAIDNGPILESRVAGRLKLHTSTARRGIVPGDHVVLEEVQGVFVIRDVLDRTTELIRPAVANVDICVAVQSVAMPSPNLELLDRMIIHAQNSGLSVAICLTKSDLVESTDVLDFLQPYRNAMYPCFVTSARTGEGVTELAAAIAGRVSTLAGPSGVGKSRLLNALCPSFQRQTGDVSEKIERGRHTTRQVELLRLPQGGWVADTPGFSVLDLMDMHTRDLPLLYPEFVARAPQCRFNSCLHRGEPGCAVTAAVEAGYIDAGRYQRYLRFLKEIEENERRY